MIPKDITSQVNSWNNHITISKAVEYGNIMIIFGRLEGGFPSGWTSGMGITAPHYPLDYVSIETGRISSSADVATNIALSYTPDGTVSGYVDKQLSYGCSFSIVYIFE